MEANGIIELIISQLFPVSQLITYEQTIPNDAVKLKKAFAIQEKKKQ
jgi:hypothetical protein